MVDEIIKKIKDKLPIELDFDMNKVYVVNLVKIIDNLEERIKKLEEIK